MLTIADELIDAVIEASKSEYWSNGDNVDAVIHFYGGNLEWLIDAWSEIRDTNNTLVVEGVLFDTGTVHDRLAMFLAVDTGGGTVEITPRSGVYRARID